MTRRYIGLAALLLLALTLFAHPGRAGIFGDLFGGKPRTPDYHLSFYNVHTHETLDIIYRDANGYNADALKQINRFMRDYRTNDSHDIDTNLLDLLNDLKTELQDAHRDLNVRYDVISGYRTRATNDMLRHAGGSQADQSQHIQGKAIDINVPGVPTVELLNTAWCLHRGGVGYYEREHFVHIDTGRKRYWNWNPNRDRCRDSYIVNE